MDTLYAFGVMIGLMKGFAEPPKVMPPPASERRQVAEAAERPRQNLAKKSEWRLDY